MFIRRKWLQMSIFWLLISLILFSLIAILFRLPPSFPEALHPIWRGLSAPGNLVPFILLILLILLIFTRQGSPLGKQRSRLFMSSLPKITFANIAGIDSVKQEFQELVEFLCYPEKFFALGACLPKGILLVGPAGTGKTLISQALAGEAGVPFFSMSGTELLEMPLEKSINALQYLWRRAKYKKSCVLLIENIEAIAGLPTDRTSLDHEREQRFQQIMTKIDALHACLNVILIGETNRPDLLDIVLLGAGHFDRQIILDLPDIRERTAILQIHAKGKPLENHGSLEIVAKQTPGFSGADLANLLNEATLLTAQRNKRVISINELEEAINRVTSQPIRRSRIISEREKAIAAYHEAGHAIVARMLPNTDPVHKISILARGFAGGFTMLLPTENRYLWSKSQFEDLLAYTLGGHVAEQLIFGEVTTGASDDIERVTKIARAMVTEYGMSSRIGPLALGQSDFSEQLAHEIDEEIRTIIQKSLAKAYHILQQNKTRLIIISERLIKEETLAGPLFESLFNQPDEEQESFEIVVGMSHSKIGADGASIGIPTS